MKRIKTFALCTVLMVMALTGQAFAYFDTGDLILNVYYNASGSDGLNYAGNEIAVDLSGATAGMIDLTATNVVLAGAGTINLTDLGLSDWSGLQAGVWAKTGTSSGDLYFGTESSDMPTFQTNPSSFFSAATTLYTYYDSTTNTYVGTNNASSYDGKMNATSDIPGYYMGANVTSSSNGEAELSSFDEDGIQYVDLYIWHRYDPYGSTASYLVGTTYAAIIRIYENGSVVLNPTTVPVPASLLLFGTGLLGFFGIKRKNAYLCS